MIICCNKIPIFDKITKNIYLGDIVAASDKTTIKDIDVIINLVSDKYNSLNLNQRYYNSYNSLNLHCRRHIQYFDFPIDDNRNNSIDKLFEHTNEIINSSVESNKKILIHCYNGVSRSVSILLAYFISKNITLKEAINTIKNNRTSKQYTRPNIGFMKQLINYEKSLLGKNSITLQEFLR